jgi:hypothetical protein
MIILLVHVFETFHPHNKIKKGKKSFVGIKLEMAKTFDMAGKWVGIKKRNTKS